MSLAELVALLVSFVLAFSRLLNVARPLWNHGPPWVQVLLPVLPPILAQLAGELGAVQTKLDLAIAIALAVLAVCVAIRGQGVVKAVVALLFTGAVLSTPACALLGANKPPAPSAADTYRAAVKACQIYRLLPADKHTREGDAACAELERLCGEASSTDIILAPPPAYGNKIVEL